MTASDRHHFRIRLDGRPARAVEDPPFLIRNPVPDDRDRLAELMLDSYIGTIDYDGEGIEEAQAEVDDYLAARPVLDCSYVVEDGDLLLAAVLITQLDDGPLVGYVMTRATAKGQGVATLLVEKSIAALKRRGWGTLDAFVTVGNTPSERLFTHVGAELIG